MSNRTYTTVLTCIAVAAGCGYTARSTLPGKYRTVAVPAFRSEVRETDLEAAVTNALRRRIALDGRLRIAQPDRADLVVRGTLTKYEVRTETFLEDDEPARVRVWVRADVELEDRSSGETLWHETDLDGSSQHFRRGVAAQGRSRGATRYFVGDLTSFPSAEQGQSTAEAIDDLAIRILYRILEY